jgi:ankyrin repeat protein
MTRLILDQSKDPSSIDDYVDNTEIVGGSLLHIVLLAASELESHTIDIWIEALIQYGVDIELRDRRGFTPLLRAASACWGDARCIPCLVDGGADIFATDESGRGALHLSFVLERHDTWMLESSACVEVDLENKLTALLAAGCDPRATDNQNRTPSEYIQNENIWNLWLSVLEKAGKDTSDEERRASYLPVS